jgi:hypothetical protein
VRFSRETSSCMRISVDRAKKVFSFFNWASSKFLWLS